MALQNLHEMIRNLSAYIKSLEVVCESGVRLAKNFERLLSPGPVVHVGGGASSSATFANNLDSDVLTQSVATWELAHKIATADANALISELLPLLQEAVQNAMKDPPGHCNNSNTYEVFRSCFSAFFQIQWRFCSLYLQCSSSQAAGNGYPPHTGFPRSPDLARSPTTTSFSSGDRRESTESCMSSFSMPRSSISGLSALSSRSSSPAPQAHQTHYYGHRSRNSSPSVKFTPSQPPSPLMPYGEGSYPYLFRRWSAHTHNFNNPNLSSGPSTNSNLSGAGSFGSSHNSSVFSSGLGSSRRWSVPAASAASQNQADRRDSVEKYDYGLLDAINLLSSKPSLGYSSASSKHSRHHQEDTIDEFCPLEQTTSLWPPSETMPGVVLTTCTNDTDGCLNLDLLQRPRHHSLCVPFSSADTCVSPSGMNIGAPTSPSCTPQPQMSGEYSLFGGSSAHTHQGT